MMDRAASIEDHVTCSICMDLYNDPLALPCLHSFCRRCIQGLFSSALVFKCPECRSDVKLGPRGIDDIPKNFQLGGIVDSYKRENVDYRHGRQEARDERSFCTQHRMTCQLMCRTCTESVCLKCIVEKHSGHKLALLSTKRDNQDELTGEVNCYMHNRSHKLYCTDCERLICLECTVNEHCHHSLSNIEESHGYHLVMHSFEIMLTYYNRCCARQLSYLYDQVGNKCAFNYVLFQYLNLHLRLLFSFLSGLKSHQYR